MCVHLEYGNKKSRKVTLSVWRPKLETIDNVLGLRAVEEVTILLQSELLFFLS
jgi:hypothetical protein